MAADLQVDIQSFIGNDSLIKKIDPRKYITDTVGELTIKDILNELKKPGLDPRNELEQFEFANIYSMEEVRPGMILPGVVTNITRFGAFVDIGVKQDGLVHVSEIASRYISDPSEVLKLNDKVTVKVIDVDLARKRINLSIKQAAAESSGSGSNQPRPQNRTTRNEKRKSEDKGSLNMDDALNALKKKFGK